MLQQCDVWLAKVKAHVKQSFKKIRIRPVKIRPSAADGLIKKHNLLLKQGYIENSSLVDAQIAKTIAEEGRMKATMFRKFCNPNRSSFFVRNVAIEEKIVS